VAGFTKGGWRSTPEGLRDDRGASLVEAAGAGAIVGALGALASVVMTGAPARAHDVAAAGSLRTAVVAWNAVLADGTDAATIDRSMLQAAEPSVHFLDGTQAPTADGDVSVDLREGRAVFSVRTAGGCLAISFDGTVIANDRDRSEVDVSGTAAVNTADVNGTAGVNTADVSGSGAGTDVSGTDLSGPGTAAPASPSQRCAAAEVTG